MEEAQKQRILGILGLAKRANALANGTNGVLDAVRNKKAKLVLIAEDVSDNTKKTLSDKAEFYQVQLETVPIDMITLGKAIGKEFTCAVALLQEGFVISYRKACSR